MPKWWKEEAFKSFASQLRHWESIYQSNGKYLELLDSLQETGRKDEKERIELEVMNQSIDPKDKNVIENIVKKLEEIFGKPKIDEVLEKWDVMTELKRLAGEDLEKFLLKFDTAEAALKSLGILLDNKIKALLLIKAMNLEESEKRSIVTNVKIDGDSIFEDLKSSIRQHKGALVEGAKRKDEDSVMYSEKKC